MAPFAQRLTAVLPLDEDERTLLQVNLRIFQTETLPDIILYKPTAEAVHWIQ